MPGDKTDVPVVHMPDFDTLVPTLELLLPIQLCCHVSKAIIFCLRERQHLISPIILNQKSIFSKTKFTQTTFLNLTRGGAAPPLCSLKGVAERPRAPPSLRLCIIFTYMHVSFPFSITQVFHSFLSFLSLAPKIHGGGLKFLCLSPP